MTLAARFVPHWSRLGVHTDEIMAELNASDA